MTYRISDSSVDGQVCVNQPDIRSYRGKMPKIAASAYIDRASVIIGDVEIGEDSSIWPLTVVRGDVHHIRIGNRTNVQDGCVLHVMKDEDPLILEDEITVGHRATLDGWKVHSRVLMEVDLESIGKYAQRYFEYKEIYRKEAASGG